MAEHTILSLLGTVLASIGFAGLYGVLWFARNRVIRSYNSYTIGGKVLVAALIGGALSSLSFTQTFSTALTAHVGIIVLVEPILKIVFTKFGIFNEYAS